MVAEADESDGSFLQYHPALAVVTNIEADHLENYDGDFGKLKNAYSAFLRQIKPGGKAVVCLDDAYVRELLPGVEVDKIAYGIDSPDADFRAEDIALGDRKSSFTVTRRGETLGRLQLSIPGRHNVLNALATLIVSLEAGLTFDQVAAAIKEFRGAKRRFQVLCETDNILVIDDYAHHPTEIQATIQAAKATGKRIIAVFQPQRYTRTFFLLEAFSKAFHDADEVILTDIYSPTGEKRIEGVSSRKLAEMIRENSNERVTYIPDQQETLQHLINTVRPGDLVLTMGAGDIWKTAHALARHLESRTGVET